MDWKVVWLSATSIYYTEFLGVDRKKRLFEDNICLIIPTQSYHNLKDKLRYLIILLVKYLACCMLTACLRLIIELKLCYKSLFTVMS